MAKKNSSDLFVYLLGIVIIGFIIFKIVGYILPDEKPTYDATTLLEAVMKTQGGKENWKNIKVFSYKKSFALYAEDGSVEKDIIENHEYDFTDGINREVTWLQNDTLFEIHRSDSATYQIKNGTSDTLITATQIQSKLNAATFVVGLPYTLDDPNSIKTYEGIEEFQETSCHVLKVTFQGSSDIWRHYYDTKDLSWKGYWVKTSDHYSLIVNEEMSTENGFTLSRKRKSYRTDSLKNIMYLRATYLYEDYKIEN